MLQNGPSRRLFESMCSDDRNGVILAGYSVVGTLANQLANEGALKSIESLSGETLPVNCQIESISFAAHTDVLGAWSFVQEMQPKNIVLVHGDVVQMKRLRAYLKRRCSEIENLADTTLFTPNNAQVIKLEFFDERIVKAMGSLAGKRKCPDGTRIAGLLVRQDFQEKFLLPNDLNMYTPLCTTTVSQQLHLPFHATFERLLSCVGNLFQVDSIQVVESENQGLKRGSSLKKNKMRVHGAVMLTHTVPPGRVLMEWDGTPSNDMVADAITSLVMQAEGSIAGIRLSGCCSSKHNHSEHQEKTKTNSNNSSLILVALLEERYGQDSLDTKHLKKKLHQITVTHPKDQAQVTIMFDTDGFVESINPATGTSSYINSPFHLLPRRKRKLPATSDNHGSQYR